MKQISYIPQTQRCVTKSTIVPRSAASGFSLYFGSTGSSGEFNTGFGFVGSGGMIFDSEDNFFGGYHNGRQLELECHFFGDRISYFYNGSLINNRIEFFDSISAIEFDKFDNSSANVSINIHDIEDGSLIPVFDIDGDAVYSFDDEQVMVPEEFL